MISATLIKPGAMLPHPCPSCQRPTLHERKGRAQCGASCGWTGALPPNVLVIARDHQRQFAGLQDGLS